jgi:hypothetical protein
VYWIRLILRLSFENGELKHVLSGEGLSNTSDYVRKTTKILRTVCGIWLASYPLRNVEEGGALPLQLKRSEREAAN